LTTTTVDFDLNGRVAIVTGAGQGIGREIAISLARAGAIVVVAEINQANAENVAAGIVSGGGRAVAIATDVADAGSVERMAARVMRDFGRIDSLINNAGLFSTITRAPMDQLPLDEWDRVMRVNVTGPFLCARAVSAPMRAAQFGRIINISSNTVALGRPNFTHYVTSKSALIGMTRALARELGPHGVTVNAVMPTLTRTDSEVTSVPEEAYQALIDRQCIKRTGTPQDLLGLLHFLSSDASAFITGQTIAADGGAVHL
jgi:NAD(P)-dependent dehydrogenase (short-subunit alcohol dehydrogenase family)